MERKRVEIKPLCLRRPWGILTRQRQPTQPFPRYGEAGALRGQLEAAGLGRLGCFN